MSNITPSIFNQLHHEYVESLSCPCTKTSVKTNTFVSSTITFHPVCSSIFVTKQWIESLYFSNASGFLVMDFRTAAMSQVSISNLHRNQVYCFSFYLISSKFLLVFVCLPKRRLFKHKINLIMMNFSRCNYFQKKKFNFK